MHSSTSLSFQFNTITMHSSTSLSFFLLFSLATSTTTTTTTTITKPHGFTKIYAFGDSFTDTGNTHSTTGPYSFGHVSNPPYGTTFFHHSTNRYSDGRLVIDFLTSSLSLPFLPPYRDRASNFSHGVDFAVAGSTAIEHEFFVKNNITIDIIPESIGTQLLWFNRFLEGKGCRVKGSRECSEAMKDALFWVGEIGANDYAYSVGSSVSTNTIQNLGVRNVFNFVQALLEKGAKYMVVQGLPLTGCLPLTMYLVPDDDRDDLGCSAKTNNISRAHNMLLQSKLQVLRRRYPNATISYADYYSAHRTIMKNPDLYGFTEPFKACCGSGGGPYNFDIFATCGSPDVLKACSNPTNFVNWDGVHLTEAMYKAVADMFFHHNYCQPPFQALLSSKKQHGS